MSKNDKKKDIAESEIREVVLATYSKHRSDILNRDFSFITRDSLVISNVDLGVLYLNTLSEGDDQKIKSVTTELLQLFYHVMKEEDQASVRARFKKAKKEKKPKLSNVNIADSMQNIMEKHKDILANAENDPEAQTKVLTSIFRDNGHDMARMAQGVLSSIGLDPSKIQQHKR